MNRIAVIGGTGASDLMLTEKARETLIETPYGPPSSPVYHLQKGSTEFLFLARHGPESTIPPHCVNYRANVWALHSLQPACLIGVNAVGGIAASARPGRLFFPDQLIDYSWGREHSFNDAGQSPVRHVEFTEPFSGPLRDRLIGYAQALELDFEASGTYGVTQGPRLETAAEIDRLERDGCDLVGMTAMPEAGLAREIGLDYAICAVVVNRAAGRGPHGMSLHAEIEQSLHDGIAQVRRLLDALSSP
ncbi:MAG TPA: S-methyl-5'-thioinosine phosphorylase [Chromatiales bacterium]|nr:S-methyl-5'-thioinosine phosphorylase [Chromatiales bacterium]